MIRFNRHEVHSKLRAERDTLPFDLHGADIAAVYELLNLAYVATNVFTGIPFPQPIGIGTEEEQRAYDLLRHGHYIANGDIRPLLRKGLLLGIILAQIAGEQWEEL